MFENWSTKKKIGVGVLVFFVIILIAAALAPSPEEETTEPAEFEVINLSLSSSETNPGGTVTVSVDVKNTGDKEGSKEVELTVNGSTKSKDVTLSSGEQTTVSFDISREETGTYDVSISGMSDSFEIVSSAKADFEVSNLQVSPSEAQPGDTIQISLDVANVGDNSGSHTIELNINQSEEKSTTVSLDEGEDKTVTFQISRDAEGSYDVEAEGLTGSFTVQEISEANIEILSTYSYTDSLGYPTVVGEVKNTGDRNANYVKIVATFYDSSGDVVDSSFTYTELDILKPNQKSPFKVSLLEDTAFDSVDTQVQWDTTDEKPYDDYEILSHSGGIDSIGYYEVTGEVKNTGNREREYNKIVATFYNSTGRVVASGYTYTDMDTLSPGQKSPFSLSVLNEDISKLIDDYSLAVQS